MDAPSETGMREREDNVVFCFKDELKPSPSAVTPPEAGSPYPIVRTEETNDG